MTSAWSGELDVGPSWALFVGQGGETRRHAHLAHKLVVALDGRGEVEGAHVVDEQTWFVVSDLAHRVAVPGRVALAFVDAGSVGRVQPEAIESALARTASTLRSAPLGARLDAMRRLVEALPVLPDARVARAARLLREAHHDWLGALARRVKLSLPRLSHLFASRLGVSPRRYRTWGALRRAIDALATGASLGDAAHQAGFADAAHFSRSFVATFGVVPSAIARGSTLRRHPR